MDVDIKKKLMLAAEWVRKNPGVVVSEHFCSDVWDDWVKSCESNEVGMDAEMMVSLWIISPTLIEVYITHIMLNSNALFLVYVDNLQSYWHNRGKPIGNGEIWDHFCRCPSQS